MRSALRRLAPCLGVLLWTAAPVAAQHTERAAAPVGVASLEERIIHVAEQVTPSVVHVQAIVRINDRRNEVTGSGFLVSEDGYVLTNQHVVEKAEKVEVSVPGHRKPFRAEVIGTDVQTDIALLRIRDDAPLPAVRFAEAGVDAVRVGQWVLAIGNPYGLEGTVSLGIVSAKGRDLEIPDLINDFIQTDAMIDRGSSGGPLVDLAGRVVGINSRGQGRGIGFTIPIDTAREVMQEILEGGVERGWLGISIQPLDRALAEHLGIGDATGVIVNSVSEGSPADAAGLRAGDVITALGGARVEAEKEEDLGHFQRRVAALEPGTRTTLGVLRKGQTSKRKVTIGSQPKVEPEDASTDLGFHVQEITERLFREARLESRRGVYVSFVARGTPAAEARLQPGDVIERIEDERVTNLRDFEAAMTHVADAERFLLEARRGSDLKFLLLKRSARPADTPPEPTGPDPGEAASTPPIQPEASTPPIQPEASMTPIQPEASTTPIEP